MEDKDNILSIYIFKMEIVEIYFLEITESWLCVRWREEKYSNSRYRGEDHYPLALFSFQFTEKQLKFLYCDTVAGQDSQHVHHQIWKTNKQEENAALQLKRHL